MEDKDSNEKKGPSSTFKENDPKESTSSPEPPITDDGSTSRHKDDDDSGLAGSCMDEVLKVMNGSTKDASALLCVKQLLLTIQSIIRGKMRAQMDSLLIESLESHDKFKEVVKFEVQAAVNTMNEPTEPATTGNKLLSQMDRSLSESLQSDDKFKELVKLKVQAEVNLLVESLPNHDKFKEMVKLEVQAAEKSLIESLRSHDGFNEMVKLKVQAEVNSLLESLHNDCKFKEAVKLEVQAAEDSLVESLQSHDGFKETVKLEVQAVVNTIKEPTEPAITGSVAERMKELREEKAKVLVDENKFRPRITSSLEISSTVMTFLIGFHTLIAIQPLSTTLEFWLVLGLILVILLGTALFLYMAWYFLGSLGNQVGSFTKRQQNLIKDAETVAGSIPAAHKNIRDGFLDEIKEGATQIEDLWNGYHRFVLLMGFFALLISVYLGFLSYVKWTAITKPATAAGSPAAAPLAEIGYSIFGRGVNSLGRSYSA